MQSREHSQTAAPKKHQTKHAPVLNTDKAKAIRALRGQKKTGMTTNELMKLLRYY